MTPDDRKLYEEKCRELWKELDQVIVKHVQPDDFFDIAVALGALVAAMAYVINNNFDGDTRQLAADVYFKKLRTSLKMMQRVEDLRNITTPS